MDGVQLAMPVTVDSVGEIRVYRLVLPFLPPSKNVYDGWPVMWKHSAKKKWVRHIVEQAAALDMPHGCSQIGLAATLVFPQERRRDLQNYAQALWHWVPDALVQAGVVDDDREGKVKIGPNWGLKFAYDSRRSVSEKKRKRTIVAVSMRVVA